MTAPTFTCPRCGRTSHNPSDVREGYCGACHDWTADGPKFGATLHSPDGRPWRVVEWSYDSDGSRAVLRLASPEFWASARELDPRIPQ